MRETSERSWAAWLVPSLADTVFAALLGFALAVRTHQFINSDGDLARHLAVGRQILTDGAVPTVDLFSYTKGGEPFVPYEWLSEVIFALVHQQLGLGGVTALAATLATLPFLLLLRWMVRGGANPLVALTLVTMGALASSMHWLARPHIFTTLLALLWTRLLHRYRETGSPRYLVALPPLMALWVNLHGGFLVGFVILGIFLITSLRHRPGTPRAGASARPALSTQHSALVPRGRAVPIALAGVASLVAIGANPANYAVIPHVLSYFGSRFMVNNTVEYLSPDFHNLGPQLFLGLLLVALISLAVAPRRACATDVGMLVVWTLFALYSARNIPLFVVTCLPVVARLTTDALETFAPGVGISRRLAATERRLGRPLLPAICIVLALLVSTGAIGSSAPRSAFDSSIFPVEAIQKVDEVGVRGNLFNYFPWGGYILYAAHPRYPVFIDGQTDFYGEQLMRDYQRVAGLKPDWESILDRYRIGWVLFPHQSPLSLLLARSPGWELAYQDSTADIFVRIPSEGQ